MPQVQHLPSDFIAAGDLLRSLIATRSNRNERLEQADVRLAVETIGRYVADATSPSLRLEATSLLGKVSETFNSKALSAVVAAMLGAGLVNRLPSIGTWGNADDRRYLAKAVALSQASWIPQYAAESLAQAEIAEKVSRDIWAELAIVRAVDLSSALGLIARAVVDWLSGRENADELAYRKLRRTCEALEQTLLTADVPTGRDFGKSFSAFVLVAGGGAGAETLKAREEAAVSVLDLVIQILRLRFDALFDSDIYRAVGTVRRWWRPARPPEAVELRSDRIANLAMRGLHILARQGVQDKELRLAMTNSLDVARVNSAGQAIAAADVSLDPKSSKFLATGQEITQAQSNEAMQELNERATDELLARLLLAIINQDLSAEAMASVADALDLFEPAQALVIRRATGRLQLVRQWVDALVTKRRLVSYASRGELVQYDPALHDTGETLPRLSEVRITSPGVIRTLDGGSPLIVIKAIVEKV